MANHLLPQPGTKLCLEWTPDGLRTETRGYQRDLAILFALTAGVMEADCEIPREVMRHAVDIGGDLLSEIRGRFITVDLRELKRQAKEESHEDP